MRVLSERRLSENEVIFRDINEQVQKWRDNVQKIAAEEHVSAPDFDIKKPLYFYCECPDAKCRKRIRLSLSDYNRIHKSRDTFTVMRGHEVPEIEDVIERNADYCIVRKRRPPPPTDGQLNY